MATLTGYTHLCKKCKKHFKCTHPNPELVIATCPICNSKCYLLFDDLEKLKKTACLSPKEISDDPVTYQ